MTLPLQGKYLLVGIGLCIKIYLPSPPRMTCIFYYQDQNNHPPHNSQFSTLHVLLDLYWDAETYRTISGAPRIRPSVHKPWIMNWECVMTKAKEEVSTFNLHLQPKKSITCEPSTAEQGLCLTNTQHHHKEGCYLFPHQLSLLFTCHFHFRNKQYDDYPD